MAIALKQRKRDTGRRLLYCLLFVVLLLPLWTEPDESPEQILRNVQEAVECFVDESEQFDDLTMLCIEYTGRLKTRT